MGWWISGRKNGSKLVMGDASADLMGPAIDEIVKLWNEVWLHDPEPEELVNCFRFCVGHLDDDLREGVEEIVPETGLGLLGQLRQFFS